MNKASAVLCAGITGAHTRTEKLVSVILNDVEIVKFKEKAYSCKTKCPHGMQTKTMPIRNDYHGIDYQMIRDFKNSIVHAGSWICTSCLYCAGYDYQKKIVQCAFDEQKQQLKLFN